MVFPLGVLRWPRIGPELEGFTARPPRKPSGYLYFDAQKFELAQPFLAKVLKKRHIASVAQDLASIEKILALKRARESARK
jgi:hypothetical protein